MQEKKLEGHLLLHLEFPLTLKVRPPHITLSSGTTANAIRSPFSSSAPAAARDTQRGGEWNPSATPHPRPARQDAQFFSRSMRCRNGSDVNPTGGFSVAIGLSQARLTRRSAVGRISTTSQSTYIPTSSRPFYSCLASGISSSTLPADTPG